MLCKLAKNFLVLFLSPVLHLLLLEGWAPPQQPCLCSLSGVSGAAAHQKYHLPGAERGRRKLCNSVHSMSPGVFSGIQPVLSWNGEGNLVAGVKG